MGIILTIIGLVLCVFFMKSIVRIIVWLFGFLVRNFIYVIIIVAVVWFLFQGMVRILMKILKFPLKINWSHLSEGGECGIVVRWAHSRITP